MHPIDALHLIISFHKQNHKRTIIKDHFPQLHSHTLLQVGILSVTILPRFTVLPSYFQPKWHPTQLQPKATSQNPCFHYPSTSLVQNIKSPTTLKINFNIVMAIIPIYVTWFWVCHTFPCLAFTPSQMLFIPILSSNNSSEYMTFLQLENPPQLVLLQEYQQTNLSTLQHKYCKATIELTTNWCTYKVTYHKMLLGWDPRTKSKLKQELFSTHEFNTTSYSENSSSNYSQEQMFNESQSQTFLWCGHGLI